jgi:RNA polymerase sigma-70 factor, ECF subfamily
LSETAKPASSVGDEGRAQRTVEQVARRSYGKLVAFLAARTHDVAAAEDALSEAFAAALADWPANGCPENPEGWLLTVARRKGIDAMRRRHRDEQAGAEVKLITEGLEAAAVSPQIPDQRLALLFACAHPALDPMVRAPLMLQVVLGLKAEAIAAAFLISPATMGQRLVRAKNKIRQAGVPFRVPEREELRERLDTVLDAIYAAFAEGWSDATGADAARRDLAAEAIFLCRVLVELLPDEPEALGLLALMLHAEARSGARRGPQGEYVPFAEQSTARWDSRMVREAEQLLRRASGFGQMGRFQLEAALQSAHVHRRLSGQNNWADVVQLYEALFAISRSPVVAINRAVAIGELRGASAGLEALEKVAADARVNQYQPYWAARADLLAKSSAKGEAGKAYEVAIGLERDPAVRRFLESRRAAVSNS